MPIPRSSRAASIAYFAATTRASIGPRIGFGRHSGAANTLDLCLLREALHGLGVFVAEERLAGFEAHARCVHEANRRLNLTRICDPQAMAVQHYADSLAVLALVPCGPERKRVVDVGSGAGFPGLVLRLACPSWEVTLVEATGKKCAFLRQTVGELGLADATVVHARAEELGHRADYRECYELALARAVAPLAVLAEYLLPLVAVGGAMVVHKGARPEAELEAARAAIRQLAGAEAEVAWYRLPGLRERRSLVLVRKLAPTPAALPRRPGAARKRPL